MSDKFKVFDRNTERMQLSCSRQIASSKLKVVDHNTFDRIQQSHSKQTGSDKFKVVDHNTFERMQQTSSSQTTSHVPKIRNSKYKRMTASNGFNLMQFVKITQRGKNLERKVRMRKRVIDTTVLKKYKGRKRENGVKKKPSRLKKSILQYRQRKRDEKIEEQLVKLEDELRGMKIDGSTEKKKISHTLHSNIFREYCNCCTTPDLKKFCEQLLRELNHYQRRAHAQNAIKARAHKRFVIGFRQVQAYLHINKIRLVIMATDCERNEGEVGLDETISKIKNVCNDQNVPIVFAFRRREMAYFLYKKATISCIGILDYDGARDIFAHLIEALKIAREMYSSLVLNE